MTGIDRAKTAPRRPACRRWQAGIFACLLAALALPRPAAAEDDAARLFRTLDKNADQQVDRDEFNIQEMEIFYFSDADRNGFLAPDETILSAASFAVVDHDKDGKLSGFEFLDSELTDFDRVDRNGSGTVTADEFEAFLETIKKPD